MQKTLYVSDMDGTLLGADSKVSDVSCRIVSALSARGALITVATARTPATVQPLMRDALTLPPAITMTGAALWSRDRECYSEVRFMPEKDVDVVLDACGECGIHPFVYTLGADGVLEVYHAAYALSHAERSFYEQRRSLPLKHFHLGTGLPAAARGRTILFCALGPIHHTDSAAAMLGERTECEVMSYPDALMPDTGILEVFAPGVSKAAAIARVKEMSGATRLVAFGDNLNDLPMLAAADLAVAVENALPQVRQAADIVIGPNTADSVARFILSDFESSAAMPPESR